MKKLLKAPEGSAQQGFHLVSFGQDENLVIDKQKLRKAVEIANIKDFIEEVVCFYK